MGSFILLVFSWLVFHYLGIRVGRTYKPYVQISGGHIVAHFTKKDGTLVTIFDIKVS